jgi:hypothetical protein
MKNIKSLIEQHTNDEGVIDYDSVETAVNDEVNNIVAKNKPDTDKLKQDLHGEVAKEIIGGLGIEGESVDDLKLWAKKMAGNTDEFKETNIKLEQELESLKKQYEEVETAKNNIEQEYTNTQQLQKIKQLGVKDDETAEFVKFKLDKVVGEDKDFDTALDEFRNESPSYFRQKEVTTFRRVQNPDSNVSDDKDADVLRAFEARHQK